MCQNDSFWASRLISHKICVCDRIFFKFSHCILTSNLNFHLISEERPSSLKFNIKAAALFDERLDGGASFYSSSNV